VNTIVPAYLGCCNDVCLLSCSFLDLSSVVFPSESFLRSLWSCGSDYSHAFQIPHDNECYQSLVFNSSIHDRAHLLAASDSAGCSSAWLKAILNPSLGLSVPVTEFIVDVPIWLGISLSPTAHAVVCLFILYQFLW